MTMNKLEKMFKMQEALNDEIFTNHPDQLYKYTTENIANAIIHECVELRDECNWKWWKQEKIENEFAIREEIIDIFHFFICLCLKNNISPDDLYEIYQQKWQLNYLRQQGVIQGREDYKPEGRPGVPASIYLAKDEEIEKQIQKEMEIQKEVEQLKLKVNGDGFTIDGSD